jgi:hypothetical protein
VALAIFLAFHFPHREHTPVQFNEFVTIQPCVFHGRKIESAESTGVNTQAHVHTSRLVSVKQTQALRELAQVLLSDLYYVDTYQLPLRLNSATFFTAKPE